MRNKFTKFTSLALIVLMLLTALVACNGTNDPAVTTPQGGGDVTTPSGGGDVTSDEGETKEEAPAVIDCDKYEFIILCRDNELWFEMYANETGAQTGEAISDALYTREVTIEQMYNCEITLKKDGDADQKIDINNKSGGDHIADILYTTGTKTLNLAKTGALRDVLRIPELRLQNSYWDQNIQKEYQIGKALYCLEGDINIRDDLRTMQVTVNKDLYEKYKLNETYGDLYDLVRNKKWKFDLMMEMSKDLYEDPDANGHSMEDTYGLLAEGTAPYYFFLGSGLRAVKNNNDSLESCLDDPLLLEGVDKAMVLASTPSVCIVNSGKIIGMTSTWTDAITLFKNDQALFRSSALSSVNGYIDMKSDYGIIPIPMLFETNDRYYCWTAAGNHYPLAIPYEGVEDISMTATIIEAMAYYSKYLETDNYNQAFYERLADFRLGQTADDAEMLDLIFDSKTFELDQPLVATKLEGEMYSKTKAGYTGSFASFINSVKTTAKYNTIALQQAFDKAAASEE